jgi:membrane protein DedA with SNARE-associated domain
MALPEHILLVYGYLLLFAWVLVEQFGIPLPATPVLLAAGALSAQHQLSFALALLAGLSATLIADSSWFFIGRRYGRHVLRLLCKLSLEPAVCVRRTQDSLGRRRYFTLLIAKFVPGLSTMAPPVAGQSGMSYARFALFDGIGATLWLSTLLSAGRFFGDLLQRNPSLLNWAGRFSGVLLVLGILGFFAGRLILRSVSSTPARSSSSSICAIPRPSIPIPSPSPAHASSRPARSPSATARFPATATSSSSATAPMRPPPPIPP